PTETTRTSCMYIDDSGAYAYLLLTERSLDVGDIGVAEYVHRMACLRDLLAPSHPLTPLLISTVSSDAETVAGWPEVEPETATTETEKAESAPGKEGGGPESESAEPWLFFLTSAGGCL